MFLARNKLGNTASADVACVTLVPQETRYSLSKQKQEKRENSYYMTDLAHSTQASIYLKSWKKQEVMYYITITRINEIEK